MLRLSCLFLTLLVGFATSGPVSFKGRESSYDYKVSVGRQDCDGVFQTGFTIATKVTVRQRTNDAYNIQLTELKVQDGSEVDLADGTYSALKEKLLIPFDFDTKSGQLTVYSPETIECESVNIKRGLVNVLEVYNEQSKTFTRISTKSSSGQCREIETKLSEKSGITELNRFISLAGNCSSSLPHIGVNTKGIAKGNLYCNRQPQVTRHATAKILRSGASASSPSFKYTGSEQLHLQSTFTHGLFDDVFAKTHLELSEVRDLTSQSWTPGTSGSTTSEVTLNSKWELDQEVARGKAAESFKELDHCLHKLDSSDHLEDQDIATTIATLLYNLRPLNKASLVELYNSLEGANKNAAFFQLLGLTGTPASFEAFEELFVKITTESPAALTTLGDTFSVYFERLDVDKLPAKTVTSMYEFWKTQLSKNTKAPQRLRNTVLLTCSAALFEACFREGSSAENCPSGAKIAEAISTKFGSDDDSQLLAIKSVANMRLRETIPFLKNILEDKSKSLSIRSQAAWAFHKVTKNNADLIVPIMADRFFDREEDHEIRIASYGALAKSKSPAELTAIIRYIVDNAQNEDRQVVSYVISSIKATKNLKYPEGTACKGNMAERSHELWDMIRPVASEFGPQDILDSGVFYIKSFESMDDVLVSIIASKDDVMPRAIFAMARDGIVSGSFSVNTVSDGLVYKNAAQLKLMLDQMRNKIRTEKADVKQQLAAVLNAAKSRPVSEDFSLIFSARIDSHERLYERFTKPEQLIQRVMAKSLVAEKYLRTFKSLGHLYVKSHTESGLRVAFVTLQTGISSAAKPQFAVGQLGKHGLPLSLKYNYKFVSRIIFSSIVGLPSSNYRFITGRISDKATAVHRNVSMSVSRGQSGDLSLATIKIRSDPLEGTANKDIFYRSIAPFHGNVESMKDYTKLLISEKKPPTVYSKGHEYLGFGATVTKSPEHTRPSIFKSPITRFCTGYQEIPTCKKPYTLKVSLSAPAADSSAIASFQVNLVSGRKGDKYIKLGALTVDDPKDNSKKVLRVVLGKAINVDDPNKRFVNFAYENRASNLFVRAFYDVQMPDTKLAIPKIVRHSSEWKTAYAGEKILINAKLQYSSSGRDDFDMEAEVNDLANGQTGDADAVLEEEFYRTAEQADAFEIGTNTVGFSENGAYMKQFNNMKTKDNFLTWKTVLAFHGFKGKLTLKKQIPDEVKLVWKKIRFVTSAMYYRHLSYDVNTKADPSTIHVSMNSTIDNSLSDLVITDKEGRQSITNYKSKVAKYMRPSSSPVPVAGKKMLNLPLCTYLGSRDDFGVDTFDGKSVFFDALNSKKCSYLLAGNCRGKKTFAITYAIDSDTFTILYDDQQRIDVTPSGFVVNGQAQPDKEGLVGKHGDTVLLAYKGLMKVMLPNKVVFIRETNSMTAYVQMSRINRGRLCGLCGDYNGDGSNDELDKLDGLETC